MDYFAVQYGDGSSSPAYWPAKVLTDVDPNQVPEGYDLLTKEQYAAHVARYNDDYLKWRDTVGQKVAHSESARNARKRQYPTVGDQLDVILKTLKAIGASVYLGPDIQDLFAQIEDIKNNNPK